jgi:hypothetical protein
MSVIDIEEHEAARDRYLLAMLELTEEMEKTDSRPQRLLNIAEANVAEKVGPDAEQTRRISDELKDDGLIASDRVLAGRAHHFTSQGRRKAERIRYEKTPLATRRKLGNWFLGSFKEIWKSARSKMLIGVGALLGTWVLTYKWDSLFRWLKNLLAG